MSNPFQQSMVRMHPPSDASGNISAGGYSLSLDEDGTVTVPSNIALELMSHGFREATEVAAEEVRAGKRAK